MSNNLSNKIFSLIPALFTVFLMIFLFASPAFAAECTGGVYAENTPSAGHEGYSVYCSAADKPNASMTPAPYCWVKTWDDCLKIQGITPAPTYPTPTYQTPVYTTPVYQTPAYQTPASGGVDCAVGSNCNNLQAQQQQAQAQQSSNNNNNTNNLNNNNTNNNNNNSSSSSSATAIAYGPTVTVTQTNTMTREIIREVPVIQTTQAASGTRNVNTQPRVVKTAGAQVKELPKTGLPIAGIALAGFVPLGLRLRKVGVSSKQVYTPTYIQEQRQSQKSLDNLV